MGECACKKKCRWMHDWKVLEIKQEDVYSALAGYATGGSEGVWGKAFFAYKVCRRCGKTRKREIR